MKRKKVLFFAGVSASVLLVSSLLVACIAADATGPGESEAAASASPVVSESESMDVSLSASVPASSSSRPVSNNQSASSRAVSSSIQSRSEIAEQSSSGGVVPQALLPASSAPQQAEPPAPQPQAPAPPPASSSSKEAVNIAALIGEAHAYAAGKGTTPDNTPVMAVNGGLAIGNAGYFNPPDVSAQTYASALSDLKWCLDQIWGMLQTAPNFNTDTSYPVYNIVERDNLVYVLYG